MKKGILLLAALFLIGSVQGAQAAARPAAKPAATPAPAAKSAAYVPAQKTLAAKSAPVAQIDSMKAGFAYAGTLDVKMFDMTNTNIIAKSSKWYFYPAYRLALANVFEQNKFGLYVDAEKPGYANITYPFIKVNELYGKFQQDAFYVKIGRQVFGDVDDLLLGLQNDALSVGFDLGNADLLFFLARVNIASPWKESLGTVTDPTPSYGTLESMLGFVPTFRLSDAAALKAYLLIGMDPTTITTGTPPTINDAVNTLVTLGGRYMADIPAGNEGTIGLNGQLGLQFGMAKTTADQNIEGMGFGAKFDANYKIAQPSFGMNLGAHLVFAGGDPEPGMNTKCGFAGLNTLPGTGPGLFNKIQDGAGPYTYVDGVAGYAGSKVNAYRGIMVFGVSGDFSFGVVNPGIGFWTYSNTDKDGKALGTEIDVWVTEKVSPTVAFYQQLAFFSPNKEGLGIPANVTAESPAKILIGSSINF